MTLRHLDPPLSNCVGAETLEPPPYALITHPVGIGCGASATRPGPQPCTTSSNRHEVVVSSMLSAAQIRACMQAAGGCAPRLPLHVSHALALART